MHSEGGLHPLPLKICDIMMCFFKRGTEKLLFIHLSLITKHKTCVLQ